MAAFAVFSEDTAAPALEYFNGFHDGFIQRIAFESQDRVHADLSQSCTGIFDVIIDFAHYNYGNGAEPFHPHDQVVHAEFRNVQDILVDFSEAFLGNTIIRLSIVPASRRKGGQLEREPCLGLLLARHYYVEDQRRYELKESRMFTFTDATFLEKATDPPKR